MRLGSHELLRPWIMAPMAGVSEMPYRAIVREMGASAAPTELVSAKGLLRGQLSSREYLRRSAADRPFWVQLFGGEPEIMAAGAECAAELGAEIIDINMGCPVRKVTKNGGGAALLKDAARAARLVEAVRLRTGLPVTVKIRSGWDASSVRPIEVARAVADAGAVAIAMHARTRAQGYSGKADWSLIRSLVQASPIPVIGNGDAATPQLARRMLSETGCAAVMIGRGALGNPWIFSQLATAAAPPCPAARWRLIWRHWRAHLEFVGAAAGRATADALRAVRRFRQHLLWYSHGLRGAAAFGFRAVRIDDVSELMELCEEYFGSAEPLRESSPTPFEEKRALG